MVGDYGEVQVMDWGLAKVLPKKKVRKQPGFVPPGTTPRRTGDSGPSPAGIDSVRSDEVGEVLKTMDGAVMGTPGFMSPEQALGKTDEVDTRTDIYALGAILYNILTLNVPVKGKTLEEILEKVTKGEIVAPTKYNEKVQSSKGTEAQSLGKGGVLPHLPDNRVPESLSAVTMRALELKTHRRYKRVKELQKEIEAYQGGYATRAEDAGTWKQFSLFVKRHKAVSILSAAILLAVASGVVISTQQWVRAQKGWAQAEARLAQLKETAPELVALARQYQDQQKTDEALIRVDYAIGLVPGRAEYWKLKADLLQGQMKLKEAADMYSQVLKLEPANTNAAMNLELCRRYANARTPKGDYPPAVVMELYKELRKQDRHAEAISVIQKFCKDGRTLVEYYRGIVEKSELRIEKLTVDEHGIITLLHADGGDTVKDIGALAGLPITELFINHTRVVDLSPLKGMKLQKLHIPCSKVTDLTPLKGMLLTEFSAWGEVPIGDLTPLKGMPLESIDLNMSRVSDLTPLKGMPLKKLTLPGTRVSDLAPLKGMPLLHLSVNDSFVTDLTPLNGMSLTSLFFPNTKVADLAPLKGMPLVYLALERTLVSDLTPLNGMKLTEFFFTPKNIKQGIEVIREMKSLVLIGVDSDRRRAGMRWPPDEFWKKYDAGEFR
jgi:tetratricopeptide (TPR) repeat protein